MRHVKMLFFLTLALVPASYSLSNNNACRHLYDYPLKFFSPNCYKSGNVGTTTPEMITSNKYSYETHTVTTEDGYILTLFRIPPKKDDNRRNKQPVFVLHGIALDSSVWVNTGNRSLGFNLARQGYDVWLGNTRGTPYSQTHTNPKITPNEFYNYTLDDLAANDLKPTLEYVANVTNQAIIYVGHSRGSTLLSMLASEFPNNIEKLLNVAIFLAPVVYFDSGFRPVLQLAEIIVVIAQPAVFYPSEAIQGFLQQFCTALPYFCTQTMDYVFGKTDQFLPDDLLNFFSRFPGRISFGEYLQYSQIYKAGRFQKFDYGTTKNLEVYGQKTPPGYNLTNISLPVVMYYGKSDKFTSAEALEKLFKEWGTTNKTMKSTAVGSSDNKYDFNHIDFIFSEFIEKFLYEDLWAVMSRVVI